MSYWPMTVLGRGLWSGQTMHGDLTETEILYYYCYYYYYYFYY